MTITKIRIAVFFFGHFLLWLSDPSMHWRRVKTVKETVCLYRAGNGRHRTAQDGTERPAGPTESVEYTSSLSNWLPFPKLTFVRSYVRMHNNTHSCVNTEREGRGCLSLWQLKTSRWRRGGNNLQFGWQLITEWPSEHVSHPHTHRQTAHSHSGPASPITTLLKRASSSSSVIGSLHQQHTHTPTYHTYTPSEPFIALTSSRVSCLFIIWGRSYMSSVLCILRGRRRWRCPRLCNPVTIRTCQESSACGWFEVISLAH